MSLSKSWVEIDLADLMIGESSFSGALQSALQDIPDPLSLTQTLVSALTLFELTGMIYKDGNKHWSD